VPELPVASGRAALRAFERLGFEEVRCAGSHHILKKAGHRYLLTVPVHRNEKLKKGTLRSLIRAGNDLLNLTHLISES